MLDELTIEDNEESSVMSSNMAAIDVTWKRSISYTVNIITQDKRVGVDLALPWEGGVRQGTFIMVCLSHHLGVQFGIEESFKIPEKLASLKLLSACLLTRTSSHQSEKGCSIVAILYSSPLLTKTLFWEHSPVGSKRMVRRGTVPSVCSSELEKRQLSLEDHVDEPER